MGKHRVLAHDDDHSSGGLDRHFDGRSVLRKLADALALHNDILRRNRAGNGLGRENRIRATGKALGQRNLELRPLIDRHRGRRGHDRAVGRERQFAAGLGRAFGPGAGGRLGRPVDHGTRLRGEAPKTNGTRHNETTQKLFHVNSSLCTPID